MADEWCPMTMLEKLELDYTPQANNRGYWKEVKWI